MVKTIVAVAGVAALAGLMITVTASGCSPEKDATSSLDGAVNPVRGKDAEADAREKREGSASCLSPNPIDATKFPYGKAVRTPNACTTSELEALSEYFRESTDSEEIVKVSDWAKHVSEGCAKCVFSDGTGDWTPIITKNDTLGDVNRGGCIEILSGKESCGRAYQQVAQCRLEACVEKCETEYDFTTCVEEADALFVDPGPCKTAYEAMENECGTNLGAYEMGCRGLAWTFEGPVRVQCITGGEVPDAGEGT
jgi:hypothetical protein